jgi:hypothetical protein
MTDQLCGIEIANAFDRPFTTILACAGKLMPEGTAGILLLVVLVFCTAAVPYVFRYYLGVLGQGAAPEGSLERKDYDALWKSLAGGNLAARLYADWLTRFLDAVDCFFGDAGMADLTHSLWTDALAVMRNLKPVMAFAPYLPDAGRV